MKVPRWLRRQMALELPAWKESKRKCYLLHRWRGRWEEVAWLPGFDTVEEIERVLMAIKGNGVFFDRRIDGKWNCSIFDKNGIESYGVSKKIAHAMIEALKSYYKDTK